MRARIATVVTSAQWERDLVAAARAAGTIRVVRRCVDPVEIDPTAVDIVVAGTETPWITSALIRRLRSEGLVVVGMCRPADRSTGSALAECDVVFDQREKPQRVVAALSTLNPCRRGAVVSAPLLTVVGPRGAPGCTEVAIALAWLMSTRRRVLLTEVDPRAPGLGIRLGLQPASGIDAFDPALTSRPVHAVVGSVSVVTAPLRYGPLSRSMLGRVIEQGRQEFGGVVVDGGAVEPWTLGFDPGTPVLVVSPTPEGLIRASRLVAEWAGPEPIVIANRLEEADQVAMRGVRAATGLEPQAVIPPVDRLRHGEPPPAELLTPLVGVVQSVLHGSTPDGFGGESEESAS